MVVFPPSFLHVDTAILATLYNHRRDPDGGGVGLPCYVIIPYPTLWRCRGSRMPATLQPPSSRDPATSSPRYLLYLISTSQSHSSMFQICPSVTLFFFSSGSGHICRGRKEGVTSIVEYLGGPTHSSCEILIYMAQPLCNLYYTHPRSSSHRRSQSYSCMTGFVCTSCRDPPMANAR
jgi:hypothetical protein